jgi:hypothetical protein
MAAKFFTGLPLDGPDPECVQGYGEPALALERSKPRPSGDHSRTGARKGPISLKLLTGPPPRSNVGGGPPPRSNVGGGPPPKKFCNESPV